MDRVKGIVYTMISAFVFGFTPILAQFTFQGGSNPVMLTFFRGILSFPVLFIYLKMKNISLKITLGELWKISLLGISGGATAFCLYSSYAHTSVGMATSLHFIYPVLVTIVAILFLHERSNMVKISALAISMIGVFLLVDLNGGSSLLGIGLALLSGVTYTFYIVFMDQSGLKNDNSIKITAYSCVVLSFMFLMVAIGTGNFTLNLTPMAWSLSILVSLLTSVLGVAFLQLGIKLIGPSTASILCTLEPITSVIMGIIIFNESTDLRKILGCVLIFLSVILLSLPQRDSQ